MGRMLFRSLSTHNINSFRVDKYHTNGQIRAEKKCTNLADGTSFKVLVMMVHKAEEL